MEYIATLLVLAASAYTLSFSKYSWNNQNKKAAAGGMILAAACLILPLFVLFFK